MRKKKEMTNPSTTPPPPPSFSSLPDEIVLSFLARISKSYYRSLCLVSKSFNSLLSSPEIYSARSQIGATEPRLYLCLRLPKTPNHHHSWFFLGETEGELRLVPVRLSSSHSLDRLNSTTVAVGPEIYQIGGSNENTRYSSAVDVFDCRSHTWRCAPSMTVARRGAKSCFLDDKIYAIGGCINREESRNWGEVFDLNTQTWKPLPKPPLIDDDDDDDDELHDKVAVFGEKLYFFSKSDARYAYDPKEVRWVPEFGFVRLEATSITGPWCVIGNVMFAEHGQYLKWYNPKYKKWLKVYGLTHLLYMNRNYYYMTIQLVNHGGKLVIIWHEWVWMRRGQRSQDKKIWCAVIRLEERSTSHLGPQIWGDVERCNIVVPTVPKSYKLSTCQSISF